jgi:hypothetical protein
MSMTSTQPPRRRAARLIRLAVVLVVFGAICATVMTAFNIGVMYGAGTSVVAVVIYSVPATLFDWPRFTLADFVELVCDVWSAIVGFFASLFDW